MAPGVAPRETWCAAAKSVSHASTRVKVDRRAIGASPATSVESTPTRSPASLSTAPPVSPGQIEVYATNDPRWTERTPPRRRDRWTGSLECAQRPKPKNMIASFARGEALVRKLWMGTPERERESTRIARAPLTDVSRQGGATTARTVTSPMDSAPLPISIRMLSGVRSRSRSRPRSSRCVTQRWAVSTRSSAMSVPLQMTLPTPLTRTNASPGDTTANGGGELARSTAAGGIVAEQPSTVTINTVYQQSRGQLTKR